MGREIDLPPWKKMMTSQNKIIATATATATAISDLPPQIICDILSRLPLTSIFRCCKLVCKTWHNLLLEPYFAKLQLSRSLPHLCLVLHHRSDLSRHYFSLLELNDPANFCPGKATIRRFITEMNSSDRSFTIAGSCNGSICLLGIHSGAIIVCNPVRGGQPFILPEPPNLGIMGCSSYGFGYSPSTDQYKVLRFYQTVAINRPSRLLCDIYSLGKKVDDDDDDAWRSIGGNVQLPLPLCHKFIFLNGALHWIGSLGNRYMVIAYFDVAKEEFGNLPLPSHRAGNSMHLGVVDNYLYFCDENSPLCVNIWVMKDYGKIGSFTLDWVIGRPFPRGLVEPVTPLKILKDGTVLLVFGMNFLASFNPETRVLEKFKDYGRKFWFQTVAVGPSFLSPWML